MLKKETKIKMIWLVGLTVLAALGGLTQAAGDSGLTKTEADGYLQWFHSLENVYQARQEAQVVEGNLLYPFDMPGWEGDPNRPYRHLSISKALTQLESQWALEGRQKVGSALVALSNARNYTNLSEYDSALVWYQVAASLDTAGHFRREIGRESLAAATAGRDSLGMARHLTNTLGTVDIIGREGEIILAYRWSLINQDIETVDHLIQLVEAQQANLTDRLRFWHAYALNWRAQRSLCLTHLKVLLQSGGLSRDLSETQRAWVLVAVPDLFFLAGNQYTAAEFYTVIKRSEIGRLRSWGEFQLANIDFLNGRYASANAGFSKVSDGKRYGSWQDSAREMVDIATELERIRKEGEPYGTASFFSP